MNIEIELSASELKYALGGLSKVAGKSSLPGLQCIRLARDESGLVTLQGSDLDTFISYRADQSQMGPGDAGAWLIPLDHLAKLVRGSSSKDRLVVVIEGEHIFLRSFIGHTPLEEQVRNVPLEDWPAMLEVRETGSGLESAFKSALQEALDCASKDPTRAALNGALLDVTQPKMHYLIGCDGRHLYVANSLSFELKESIIVPSHKFLAWSGFMNDGDWSLSVLPGTDKARAMVKLSSKHWEFVTRAIKAEYPNWKQAIPAPEREKTVLELSKEAAVCVSQAVPRLPGDACADHPISMRASEGRLLLCGRHQESDCWTEIAVPGVGIVGPAAQATLNRLYLLKAVQMGLLEVELSGTGVPILFRSANRQLVVAPLTHEDMKTRAGSAPSSEVSVPHKPPCPSVCLDSNGQSEGDEEEQQQTPNDSASECKFAEGGNGPPLAERPSDYDAITGEIERIKCSLMDVLGQLDTAVSLLKAAEAEQALQDKEVESIRITLRSLRDVKL